jgi:hypothetical protein
LADCLTDEIKTDYGLNAVQSARSQCNVYAIGSTTDDNVPMFSNIDLAAFCDAITRSQASQRTRNAAADVKADVLGSSYAWAGTARQTQAWLSKGASIYFPASGKVYELDKKNPSLGMGYEMGNTDHPVEFVHSGTIHWADFLHRYFQAVPGN